MNGNVGSVELEGSASSTPVQITESRAREKFIEYVKSQWFWDTGPAESMEIFSIESMPVYEYAVETCMESRATSLQYSWYDGLSVPDSNSGTTRPSMPSVWDVPVTPLTPFKNSTQVLEVPNSSCIVKCSECKGEKSIRCYFCSGRGSTPCPLSCGGVSTTEIREESVADLQMGVLQAVQSFLGPNTSNFLGGTVEIPEQVPVCDSGSASTVKRSRSQGVKVTTVTVRKGCQLCNGQGRLECFSCTGTGLKTCGTCGGFGLINRHTELKVTRRLVRGQEVVGSFKDKVPQDLIQKAQGTQLIEEESTNSELSPLNQAVVPVKMLVSVSEGMIAQQVAQCDMAKARIVGMRHKLREVPMTVVRYNCDGTFFSDFTIFGLEENVYATKYPDKCRLCWFPNCPDITDLFK